MVGVKIDGIFLATTAAIVGGVYLWRKKDKVIAAVNPADENNLVNQAVIKTVGEENYRTGADRFFGAIDLINPFADETRKRYARQVYGIGEDE